MGSNSASAASLSLPVVLAEEDCEVAAEEGVVVVAVEVTTEAVVVAVVVDDVLAGAVLTAVSGWGKNNL